mmetsp:Transcript_61130/g.132783  ORF Transcript_61130/g.132783 Transcript_61130/m.132783 type:complete len:97 (-) Transcript_61130:72-362(-)
MPSADVAGRVEHAEAVLEPRAAVDRPDLRDANAGSDIDVVERWEVGEVARKEWSDTSALDIHIPALESGSRTRGYRQRYCMAWSCRSMSFFHPSVS